MTYPALPFENHTWRLTNHQGVLTPKNLNALLFAASTYQTSRDPAQEINNYLVGNSIFPPNIRTDSRQADVWRDYQQVLSEQGLMQSTKSHDGIKLTPIGLSFFDGGIGFTDLTTIQAFRYQYPNGHNTRRTSNSINGKNFAEQQIEAGVLIKPAVFLWQVLEQLSREEDEGQLSAIEIEQFVIPAKTHRDIAMVIAAIRQNRSNRRAFPSGQTKQRRHGSNWMKRLIQTHAFSTDSHGRLCLSDYSRENKEFLVALMTDLAQPGSFWSPPSDVSISECWYQWYGTFDSKPYPIPTNGPHKDFGGEPEPEDIEGDYTAREITVKPYDLNQPDQPSQIAQDTISAVYSADLSNKAHRLHDTMVRLIAATCERKQARVFSDPQTLDLLVEFEHQELLIEVKSATSLNLNAKIRSALGQVTYYDYLRSRQTTKRRRRGIALTLEIQEDHWSKDFLTNYLDVDLITLRDGALYTYSQSAQVSQLIS
jgi:hypothetical protein